MVLGGTPHLRNLLDQAPSPCRFPLRHEFGARYFLSLSDSVRFLASSPLRIRHLSRVILQRILGSGKLATGSTLPAESMGIPSASVVDLIGHVRTLRGQQAMESLLRNLTILKRLGCLTPDNLARLRRGNSPVITRGPYAGEKAEVDHIVPVSKAPRFENWIGNLEFMPMTLSRRKSDKMGERQEAMLNKLRAAFERT